MMRPETGPPMACAMAEAVMNLPTARARSACGNQ